LPGARKRREDPSSRIPSLERESMADKLRRNLTVSDFLRYKAASPEMLAYLWLAMENKKTVLVCGPSGCGKSTTWNILTGFIPRKSPSLIIQDRKGEDRSAEIRASSAGFPKQLDYLLIRELHGQEAYEAFYKMAEGQAICTTIACPADPKAFVSALEGPPLNMPRILLTALNILVLQEPVEVRGTKERRMTRIVEFVGYETETNELITNWTYEWEKRADSFRASGHSFMLDELSERKGLAVADLWAALRRRAELLQDMVRKDVKDPAEVTKTVETYVSPGATGERPPLQRIPPPVGR